MTGTRFAQALVDAAGLALHAPSLLNTQPWRWRVRGAEMDLLADRSRQVRSIDPDGRMLTISCGAALHHARAALAADGYEARVDRFPEPTAADLLATLHLVDADRSHHRDSRTMELIRLRHTDRRPFAANAPVPDESLHAMAQAAQAEDARLYRVSSHQLPSLDVAAARAAEAEAAMADYQADLYEWTHRPRTSGDGVPVETLTAMTPRHVSLRDAAPNLETLLDPGFGDDRFAEFLILATTEDTAQAWLRAGEATSAAWLVATGAGLVASALGDTIQVPTARAVLRQLLHPPGEPQLVLRVAVDMQPPLPRMSPRRSATDVIDAH
jgi:hypothetical protein